MVVLFTTVLFTIVLFVIVLFMIAASTIAVFTTASFMIARHGARRRSGRGRVLERNPAAVQRLQHVAYLATLLLTAPPRSLPCSMLLPNGTTT